MSSDHLLIQHLDSVTTIVLNRPERLNALDPTMLVAFDELLQTADTEPSTNVIVITGAGRAFTAGGDIKSFGSAPDHRVRRRAARFVDTFLSLEKPVIAKVNGPAIGLGLTIVVMCDSAIAADDALLGDPHVKLGAAAGDGAAFVLPLLVGPQRAKDLLMTGRSITGIEAAAMGMINRSVPADRLDSEVAELAATLAAQPTYAVRATKAVVNRLLKSMAADLLDVALAYEEISRHRPEYQEAVNSWKNQH